MNLTKMRFKEYIWENNPISLSVTLQKKVKERILPFVSAKTEEMTPSKRIVSGKGCFIGNGNLEAFQELEQVFTLSGAGSLYLPGMTPFLAVMQELELVSLDGEGVLTYAFSFLEMESYIANSMPKSCIAKSGESLWDIAHAHSIPIDLLAKCNQQIRDICRLNSGEEVLFP